MTARAGLRYECGVTREAPIQRQPAPAPAPAYLRTCPTTCLAFAANTLAPMPRCRVAAATAAPLRYCQSTLAAILARPRLLPLVPWVPGVK